MTLVEPETVPVADPVDALLGISFPSECGGLSSYELLLLCLWKFIFKFYCWRINAYQCCVGFRHAVLSRPVVADSLRPCGL